MKSFFTPLEVEKILGLSYRQLQYWDKTNFIKPSYRRKSKYRIYTFTDLFQLWLSVEMRDTYSVQALRKLIEELRKLLPQTKKPLIEHTFRFQGDSIMIFDGNVVDSDIENKKKRPLYFKTRDLRNKVDSIYAPRYTED